LAISNPENRSWCPDFNSKSIPGYDLYREETVVSLNPSISENGIIFLTIQK